MSSAPIPEAIAQIERPQEALMKFYVLKAVATMVAFPITLVVLYFRFHTMRYRFDPEGIHMSWGILFRHEIMLNYSRIQDIHLHSNFIERWLGLARIEIATAAGASDSEMTLEGIENPEGMRDFLYSRMRGAHTSPEPAVSQAQEPLAAILTEIAGELRGIREHLEHKGEQRT